MERPQPARQFTTTIEAREAPNRVSKYLRADQVNLYFQPRSLN
jgi:hypothetical protein